MQLPLKEERSTLFRGTNQALASGHQDRLHSIHLHLAVFQDKLSVDKDQVEIV
jgi:hypothetical protein